MRIAYAGFDLLSPALKALLESGCILEELFTCPVDHQYEFNCQVIELAQEAGASWSEKPITREDIGRLKEKGCDALICGAYYYRIPTDREFPMVNIHPSPLPYGRGAWPMPVQILRGEKTGGVTVHRMEEEFDRGDILLQQLFSIGENENLETMTETIRGILPGMMRNLAENFFQLYKNAVPQGEGSDYPCPREKDWTIGPYTDIGEADRILRAFYGFPCIYETADKRLELFKGRIGQPGIDSLPVEGGWIVAETVKEIQLR